MRSVKTNMAARYPFNIGFKGPKIKMSFIDRRRTSHFCLTSYKKFSGYDFIEGTTLDCINWSFVHAY